MKTSTRHTLAAALSFVVHGGLVLSTVDLVPEIDMPELEFEFTEVEMLDPDLLQGEEPAGPVEEPPPVLQPEPPPPGEEPGPEPEENAPEQEEPEPKRNLGEKSSRADQLGPTNSVFYGLLVPKKIRKLKFREHAMDIMAPLPDFDFLIGKGGFDALRDFDHIVIASPDIRDITQTFLAVDYTIPREEVKAAIERAAAANKESIEWIEEGPIIRGNPKPLDPDTPDVDPRWFVLLEDDIAVYVRREFLPHILEEEESDKKTAGNYVANLVKLRRFAQRQPTAGLQIVLKDLRAALKRARGLPFEVPDRIELSAEAKSDPELMIRVGFLTAVDAKAAENWWNDDLSKYINKSLAVKLSAKWIYDLLEVERDGKELRIWGSSRRNRPNRCSS